ncbi:MAG: OB-fold putative lipoprotein [Flavobacteriaceae bacterium]|nr:OB-fold putative lipoprotein [Flavobacteriaceae bacterium]
MKSKILFIGVVVFSLLTITTLIRCQLDPDQRVSDTRAVNSLLVDQLILDPSENSSHLIGDVIAVDGLVDEVNYLNDRATIILRGYDTEKKAVICDMQESQRGLMDSLEVGQAITVKGVLKGFLHDVILLNCIISNPTNHD